MWIHLLDVAVVLMIVVMLNSEITTVDVIKTLLIIFYFVIGFFIYFSTVKNVKRKIAFIKADTWGKGESKNTKFVVWWIGGLTIWGVAGIFLIVSWFFTNAG
ncbi:hypothetical protein [Lentibacillus daqui]|uniref:hypothetical protein n=1 Tax=Lentibacillus daqui TaxID=2911514 RepID=UPI0022B21C59|nr:hypothetical protein [Lentibacillus daqui]